MMKDLQAVEEVSEKLNIEEKNSARTANVQQLTAEDF